MAKVYKGNITFGSAFSPNGAKPIDDRLVVDTSSDLLTQFKDGTAYKGMLVTVLDAQSAYMLAGSDPTDISSWSKLATEAHVEINDRSIDLLNSSVNALEKYFTTTGVQDVIDTFLDVSKFLGQMKDSSNLFDMMASEHAGMTSYVDTKAANLNTSLSNAKSSLDASIASLSSSTTAALNSLRSDFNASLYNASSNLHAAIDSLNASAASADQVLEAKIDNASSAINARIDSATSALNTSLSNAQSALNASIGALNTSLSNAKSALNTSLANATSALNASIGATNASLASAVSALNTSISNTSANIHAAISDLSTNLASFKASTGTDMSDKMAKVQQVIGVDASFKDSRINDSNVLDYVDATVDDASKYRTALGDGVKTTVATGDIAKGTTVAQLKAMSTNEIITKMLFKDYQPTTTYPSISISANGASVLELGASISKPTVTKTDGVVKALANDGSGVTWDAAAKTWTDWASAETIKVNGTANTAWPYTPASTGTYNMTAEKAYTRSSTAWNGMTSQGNNATIPTQAASGTAASGTIAFKAVEPIFTNGTWTTASASISYPASAASSPNKTVLDDGDAYILFASQASGSAFEIYMPTAKSLKSAYLRNELTGGYDSAVTFAKSGTKSVTTLKGSKTYDVYKYASATQGNAKVKINFG